MKAQIKVSPSTIIEVEADKQKDLFKAVTSAHEVFGEKCCGLCGSTNIRPVWRTATRHIGKKVEVFDYPEYRCDNVLDNGQRCGARLSIGTINDDTGTLFPVRRLIDGKRPATKAEKDQNINGSYGPHNGWYRFHPGQTEGGQSEDEI